MAVQTFDIGDDVVLTLVFTVNGVPTDATTQTCTVIDSAGTETVVGLNHQGAGTYQGTFSPTVPGDHWVRGAGTGTAKAAAEVAFTVRKRRVP